jgi:dUTP pyrophosphatase
MEQLWACQKVGLDARFKDKITTELLDEIMRPKTLSEVAQLTKSTNIKPTLVPTGIKCEMPKGMYLELSVRSSCPLKHWLILANGVGIIDADYYNNPDNEGHIYFQIINLSPFDILLKKGDTIGQGIFHKYFITDDDAAQGERTGGFGSTDSVIDIGLSLFQK